MSGVGDLCGVGSLPSATAEDRAALISEADRRYKAVQSAPNNAKDRAVLSATVDLIAAGYPAVAPTGAPSPLASLLAQGTEQPIKDALGKLKAACE